MQNIKLALGIIGLVSLLGTIIATPALASESTCTVRPLEQGSGNVRVCEAKR